MSNLERFHLVLQVSISSLSALLLVMLSTENFVLAINVFLVLYWILQPLLELLFILAYCFQIELKF